jgi:ATP-binding cassette subfamily B protein
MKPWLSLSLRYGRRQAVPLGAVLGVMTLEVAFTALTPWPLKLIVDNVLPAEPLPAIASWLLILPGAEQASYLLAWLAFATLLLFAGRQAATMIKGYVQAGAAMQLKLDLGRDIFDALQRQSLRFHYAHKTGDMVRRVIHDADFVRKLVVGVILPGLTSVTTLLVMFGIMWTLSPMLSLLSLVAALPMPILVRWLTPKMAQRSYEQAEAEGALLAVAEQAITSLPVVQAFGGEVGEEQRFRGGSRRAVRAYLQVTRTELQFGLAVGAVTALGTAVLMVLGGQQVAEGQLSTGTLLVFIAYLAASYQPLEALSNLSATYANSEGQARRVIQVLEAEADVSEHPAARRFVKRAMHPGVSVTFDNVSFGYEPDQPVLSGVDLSVAAGEKVALVGATGAGKTTLVSLVPRFFDVWTGRVLIEGIDVREIEVRSLRERVAFVMQESQLLPLSIAENIAYGRPGASHDEIVAAAVTANADEFIRRLPAEYDTVIGERGAMLSVGQRQRLAIARALLKDAPILILDEPTSALDMKTEKLVIEALDRLMADRTVFIIAHRYSTIHRADRVVELRDGEVHEAAENRPGHRQ